VLIAWSSSALAAVATNGQGTAGTAAGFPGVELTRLHCMVGTFGEGASPSATSPMVKRPRKAVATSSVAANAARWTVVFVGFMWCSSVMQHLGGRG
jgi:hypothetical protein